MTMYLIFIAILLLEGAWLLYWKADTLSQAEKQKNKKIYIILVIVEFILFSGLRSMYVGADTWYYLEYFQAIDDNYTWPQMIAYVFGGFMGPNAWFEPLYTLYIKTVHAVSGNEQFLLLVTACVIFIPLATFVYRYSRDMSLSFLIYMCLFFQCFGITAIRQAIALSIVMLFGYRYIEKRELWKFLICVVIAFFFHKSAIIALPFYFLHEVKLGKKMRCIYVALFAFIFLAKDIVIEIACKVMGYAYSGTEGAKAFNMVLLMCGVTGFVLLFYDKLLEMRSANKGFINAMLIGTLILPFTQVDNTYMRLCYYYYMFLMIIIPEIVLCFPKKLRAPITICGYFGMIVLFARHGLEYTFFWQV